MKLVKGFALIIGMLLFGYMLSATVYQWNLDSNHDGTSEFRIDTDGNTEIAGTLAVTGATTQTGALTIAGATTVNDILTISSDSATGAMQMGGVFATLPTTGYTPGSIIFYTGASYPGIQNTLLVSTATVTTVSCWVKVGGQ